MTALIDHTRLHRTAKYFMDNGRAATHDDAMGILRGFADVKAPMLISGFSYIGVGVPVSYVCAFTLNMGPEGIWYGFLAGLIAAGTLLTLRIRKKLWGQVWNI